MVAPKIHTCLWFSAWKWRRQTVDRGSLIVAFPWAGNAERRLPVPTREPADIAAGYTSYVLTSHVPTSNVSFPLPPPLH